MPYKDPEVRKQKQKEYREANKELISQQKKDCYRKREEYYKEKAQNWRSNNPDRKKQLDKEYHQTDKGKKIHKISSWRTQGVIHENFDELYEYYINCKACENCNVELVEGMCGSNKRCLDHSHKTGKFRNVLCCKCNIRRKEDNI